jgi:hypothetical protein
VGEDAEYYADQEIEKMAAKDTKVQDQEREDREQMQYERGYGDAVDELNDFFLDRAKEAERMRKRVKTRDSKLRHDGIMIAFKAVLDHIKKVQKEVHGEEACGDDTSSG